MSEEHLRPRNGSDNQRKGILYFGRRLLYLEDGLKGKHEGSCQVSDKLSNSRGYLLLFFNQGEGYLHKGIIYIVLVWGQGKYKELNNNVSS